MATGSEASAGAARLFVLSWVLLCMLSGRLTDLDTDEISVTVQPGLLQGLGQKEDALIGAHPPASLPLEIHSPLQIFWCQQQTLGLSCSLSVFKLPHHKHLNMRMYACLT